MNGSTTATFLLEARLSAQGGHVQHEDKVRVLRSDPSIVK